MILTNMAGFARTAMRRNCAACEQRPQSLNDARAAVCARSLAAYLEYRSSASGVRSVWLGGWKTVPPLTSAVLFAAACSHAWQKKSASAGRALRIRRGPSQKGWFRLSPGKGAASR